MGCICSKGINKDEIAAEAHSVKLESTKSLRRTATSTKKEEAVVPENEATPQRNVEPVTRTVSKSRDNNAVPLDEGEKKVAKADRKRNTGDHKRRATAGTGDKRGDVDAASDSGNIGVVDMPNGGSSGEHVSSGWPNWLTSVAGEAIKGWLPRRADSFEKLDKIGQGTYSSVYKARDLETGKIVALKKVRFVNMDPESVRFMAREIHILRRLDHPNVIKLEGIVTSRMSSSLYLVFEYMDHDLSGLAAASGTKFTEPQIKCFMHQLLSGLEHCHGRGILHRDIKGSNLLVDSNGILRIGDFGLAAAFDPKKKQPLTSRVVTLWYRPPELLLGATDYGVAVDLWSAGCILAELLAGKPIMPGRTEVEQLHKIFKLCGSPAEDYWRRSKLSNATIFKPHHQYPRRVAETFRDFPSSALALLDILLAIEPEDRGTAASALRSDFFTTKPFACDPSSLPKFPPSKEYDAKLRDEETRRQREATTKGQGSRGQTDRKTRAKQNGNMEKQKRKANPKSCSEKYNSMEDSVSGFPIEPRSTAEHDYPHAGSTMHPGAYGTSRNKSTRGAQKKAIPGRSSSTLRPSNVSQFRTQRSCMPQSGLTGDLSNFSGLADARKSTNSKHNRLDVDESSEEQNKKDERMGKDACGGKNRRIHCSGPLVPPGGNMEDMLKEHERQIQQAVRKARLDKAKTKDN